MKPKWNKTGLKVASEGPGRGRLLAKLMRRIRQENRHREIQWGPAVGKEGW
jgi:hypothetical protein